MEPLKFGIDPKRHLEDFISEALYKPVTAIPYQVSRTLTSLYPEKAILEGQDYDFSLTSYAQSGHCTLTPKAGIHPQLLAHSDPPQVQYFPQNVWYEVGWQGHSLDVLWLTWQQPDSRSAYWVVAEKQAIAEAFLLAVSEWYIEVRSEILVFESGSWIKSEALFQSIQGTTFDNLVLSGSLKQDIQADLQQFFASQELYKTHGIPWKRGILFIGPPGNGKTHAVKALINASDKPCLYVKSFDVPGPGEHYGIRAVFERARRSTPCILVLEDLDSLLNDYNRSFFLNELDGFAANSGIVTLATTNHPERLDPAILQRPSRFDRKYHFELPELTERLAYIALWNDSLQPTLRLSAADITQIADTTAEFSYAYIKELFLSAMMQWISSPQPGGMAAVMQAQAVTLREQMRDPNAIVEEGGLSRPPRQYPRRRGFGPGYPPRPDWNG